MDRHQRVIIIEDDEFLAKMYEKKLGVESFVVKIALNGKDGLKLINQFKPDLIILDLLLPGISGWEVLKILKGKKATKDIPVIILSNLNKEEQVDRGLSLGAEDYLVKVNFLPSEVINKIKEVLWRHKKNFT